MPGVIELKEKGKRVRGAFDVMEQPASVVKKTDTAGGRHMKQVVQTAIVCDCARTATWNSPPTPSTVSHDDRFKGFLAGSGVGLLLPRARTPDPCRPRATEATDGRSEFRGFSSRGPFFS